MDIRPWYLFAILAPWSETLLPMVWIWFDAVRVWTRARSDRAVPIVFRYGPTKRIGTCAVTFCFAGAVSALVNRGGAISWLTLVAFAAPFTLVWLAAQVTDHLDEERMLSAFTVSGFVAALYSIIVTLALRWDRAMLPGIGENGTGTLMLVVVGIGCGWLSRSQNQGRALVRTVVFIAIVVGALILTKSRGAWLAFIVMVLIMASHRRQWRLPALVVVVSLGLVFLISETFASRLLSALSLEANANRLHIWDMAIEMIKENPWWGIGPGQFPFRFSAMTPYPEQIEAVTAHNIVLTLWAEYGLLGLVSMLAIFGQALSVQYRLASCGDPLWVGVFAATVGILVHQLVDHTLFSVKMLGLFAALIGWSLAEAARRESAVLAVRSGDQ